MIRLSQRIACLLLILVIVMPLTAGGQTAREVRPAENLVVQGIPPIPASLAGEVRRYTEFRAAIFVDWHPVERETLIATRFGNTLQIHRVRHPGGARTQLTFFEEPVAEAVYEPKAGRYFLFTRDVGGNEFGQIYRYDMADGHATLLTDGGRSQNYGIRWNRRGDRIAYGSTRRNGADRDIYVMDPLDPKTDQRVLQVQGGGWSVSDWSPDDRQLLIHEEISVNEQRLWLVDVAKGEKVLLTDSGKEIAAYGNARFTQDGNGLYLITDKNHEFAQLSYMDLKSKDPKPLLTTIPWDVEMMEVSPDGKRIAFVTNEAGISRMYLYDVGSRKHELLENVPTGVIGELRWRPNGKEFAFSLGSARFASDVYSVDVDSRTLTRWTESELGGLVAEELSEPGLIRWKSFDEREITGFMYSPPARFPGKRPVLILIHGGPEGQSRPTFLGRMNYLVNELGVVVIFPNVRGSLGHGKTFVMLDNGLKREDSVKDIGALLDWIAKQPNLEAERVMVYGGSYGGYMTLASSVHFSDRLRCAIDVVGISNFNTFLKNTESYRRDLRRAEYGDERIPEIRDFFERTAPLNNAAKIRIPLFVVQGGNDPRVPRSEAEQIVERVRTNGIPVWYLLALDEGHGFRKKTNADFQFYAVTMFIRQHLLASESN